LFVREKLGITIYIYICSFCNENICNIAPGMIQKENAVFYNGTTYGDWK